MKIIENPDKSIVEYVDEKLRQNYEQYGERYCPCALVRDDDHICMCKDFREQTIPGECHCGKFIKIEE